MKTSQSLVLSAILASTTFLSIDAQARDCSPRDPVCVCQTALESGSRQMMRNFLRKYPNADTICNATASTFTIRLRDDSSDDIPTNVGERPTHSKGDGYEEHDKHDKHEKHDEHDKHYGGYGGGGPMVQ